MRMIMADAAAPQNSISTGTSMRMSVKVKYVLWRVLKDASQDSQKQRAAGEEEKKKQKTEEGKERKNDGGKMKIMCLRSATIPPALREGLL